jgi:hypothetical protein
LERGGEEKNGLKGEGVLLPLEGGEEHPEDGEEKEKACQEAYQAKEPRA